MLPPVNSIMKYKHQFKVGGIYYFIDRAIVRIINLESHRSCSFVKAIVVRELNLKSSKGYTVGTICGPHKDFLTISPKCPKYLKQ